MKRNYVFKTHFKLIDSLRLRSSIWFLNNTIHHLRALEEMVGELFEKLNQITTINVEYFSTVAIEELFLLMPKVIDKPQVYKIYKQKF